jgi:DNA-binding protein H-NS
MDFKSLSIQQLEKTIGDAQRILDEKKAARRAELQAELEALGKPVKQAKAKASAKYRSKSDPSKTWGGRGAVANWLKKEMEETGQPLDAFSSTATTS